MIAHVLGWLVLAAALAVLAYALATNRWPWDRGDPR